MMKADVIIPIQEHIQLYIEHFIGDFFVACFLIASFLLSSLLSENPPSSLLSTKRYGHVRRLFN